MFEQIDLTDATMVKEFGMGCLQIKGAHLWPLDHFVWEGKANEVGATFFCQEIEPWDKTSLLRIEVFKLPKANDELQDRLRWYNKGRKKRRIRIADGDLFDEGMLHVKGFGDEWERDAFPLSKGEIIRVYRSKKLAVIFRFLAKSGTLLDHPVFKRVIKNIAIVDGQWQKPAPDIIDCTPKAKRTKEIPLTDDEEAEMWEIVGNVMKELKLRKVKEAEERFAIIEQEILSARKIKKSESDQIADRAIELGTLAGQIFCWMLDWEWCRVRQAKGSESICVCNPNRSIALAPVEWIQDLILDRKRPLNCLLTFNMIQAGRLPPSRPYSYARIQ